MVILSIFLRVLSKLTKGSTEADCGGSVAQKFSAVKVWRSVGEDDAGGIKHEH